MARRSSGDCYFVVAVVPKDVCIRINGTDECTPTDVRKNSTGETLDWRQFAPRIDAAAELIEASRWESFGGRMAYVVLERAGRYDRFPTCMDPLWHGVQMVAQHAAGEHGLAPHDHTPVLRTRPDVLFDRAFNLSGAVQLFSSFENFGQRILFGQNGSPDPAETGSSGKLAQTENMMFTSWGGYRDHIAAAIEGNQRKRAKFPQWGPMWELAMLARHNMWGHGYSEEGTLPDGRACYCLQFGVTEHGCLKHACLMLVLESYTLPNERILRAEPDSAAADLEGSLFDLTAAAYPYAPMHDPLGDTLERPVGYREIDLKFRPWMREGSTSHVFYRAESPVPLVEGGAVRPFHLIWPDAVRARYLSASAHVG